MWQRVLGSSCEMTQEADAEERAQSTSGIPAAGLTSQKVTTRLRRSASLFAFCRPFCSVSARVRTWVLRIHSAMLGTPTPSSTASTVTLTMTSMRLNPRTCMRLALSIPSP